MSSCGRSVAAFVSLCALFCIGSVVNAQDQAADSPQNRVRDALARPASPIGKVLEDWNSDTIPDSLLQAAHVRGVVTIGSGTIADDRMQVHIQDDTGGLYLFARRPRKPLLAPGDIVDVAGIIDQYRGSVQLIRPRYTIVGHTAVPKPIRVSLRDAASWKYYGRLIEVDGTIERERNWGDELTFRIADRDAVLDLVIAPKVIRQLDLNSLQRGTRVRATGVASIYSVDRPYRQGFQLIVPSAGAIRVTGRALPQWVRTAIIASAAAVALAAALGFIYLRSRRANRHRRRELAVLSEVSGTVARAGADVGSLLSEAVSVMSRHQLIQGAVVHLVEGNQLQLRGTFGVESDAARAVDEQIRSRLSAPLVAHDSAEQLMLPLLHPLLCIPLHGRSRTVGVLTAFTSARHTPTPEEASTIAAVANVIALGVENIQVLEEAEVQQDELKQLAITDPLTGLYNRRFLDEYLRIHLPMAKRQAAPVSFIAIDLDDFKRINDTHGHDAGDVVLREFGTTVRRLTRASDLPVRLGGEEFLVVMPDTDESGAVSFATRLRDQLRHGEFGDLGLPADLRLTASVGIALYPEHGEQVGALLRAADEALYESKRSGRDRITVAPLPLRLIEA